MVGKAFRHSCENLAVRYRHDLGLHAYDPLPARHLARHLQTELTSPEQLPDMDENRVANLLHTNTWWAIGIPTDPPMVIYHPLQPATRFESSVMHELAHFILGHKPEKLVSLVGNFVGRDYSRQDEEEAKYLGSCLQISKPGLDWAVQRQLTLEKSAQFFGASEQLVRYRLNMTGRRL